jgi:phosphomannomutase
MSVIDEARAWIAQDPDPETRRELEALIATEDLAALEERFRGSLRFGTAGLRGLLGAGPARMNRVSVSRATAGFCSWLKKQVPEAASRGICVGRDARPNSEVFQRDVIEVASAAGIPVFAFSEVVPTPVLAFAVLQLRAAGGVMITASHNPRGYNGYKVYWENGAQIVPPNDAGIASEIEVLEGAPEIPRLTLDEARDEGLLREVDALRQRYVEAVADELPSSESPRKLRIAYTALHGVAERTFRQALIRAGFEDLYSVLEQSSPDGTFPTVDFPNPEEPGAMDRVIALGAEVRADLVIANDPDGDRVAAACPAADDFELLSGNDIGVLLADDLLRQGDPSAKRVVLSTVVSSPLLGPVAESHGARWEQTLTGHKWIQNRALELEREGYAYVFGYEEALGYAPSMLVRDKDGISSALRLADLAARLKSEGRSLLDARDALWREHGFVADRQVSLRFDGPEAQARMSELVERVRREPPTELGGARVLEVLEPDESVLILELEGGHRAMLRPSGTEPKLKYYFYAVGRVGSGETLEAVKRDTRARLARMVNELTGSSDC